MHSRKSPQGSWKLWGILILLCLACLYAIPNLYGEYPAVQIIPSEGKNIDLPLTLRCQQALKQAGILYQVALATPQQLLYRFSSTDEQLRAKTILQQQVTEHYLVALNLNNATPRWLTAIGATPMKLGLDLRGGVHFLLQVDIQAMLDQQVKHILHDALQLLRDQRVHYQSGIYSKQQFILTFTHHALASRAYHLLTQQYATFAWSVQQQVTLPTAQHPTWHIIGMLPQQLLTKTTQDAVEQTMQILRNRVNELGISEAIVQQQGANRIAVDLPGIQDTAQAKNILGKTATLAFQLVDTREQPVHGVAPPDTQFMSYHGQTVLLKKPIILQGTAIATAQASVDDETNLPEVMIRLKGNNRLFTETTANNIGQPLAVVFVEVKSAPQQVAGKSVIRYQTSKHIISIANITTALGNQFRITGLATPAQARLLALLLRAGSLPTPVTIIAERQIGPSLGQHNIQMGQLSIVVGMGLVMLFMALYYRVFGLIANLALLANLILIIAILSILGATLTLTGMAGIVLTVGMAVDANVLIFERIREEIRRGLSPLTCIHAGYRHALTTILDANITTLIVMIILFSLGAGTIKGIAITVTIGLITSMITAIAGTRTLLDYYLSRHPLTSLSIGIQQ